MDSQKLWDNRFDGHRFVFHVQQNTGKTTMNDTLYEFESIELPNDIAELFATMLNDLHDLQMYKKSEIGVLKTLISISEESNLDKDVLIACIKYAMEYKND